MTDTMSDLAQRDRDIAAKRAAEKAELDRLQATVAKLPKYADTGKPFVPGVDEAWGAGRDHCVEIEMAWWDGAKWVWHEAGLDGWWIGLAYSTKAAAEAAKEHG